MLLIGFYEESVFKEFVKGAHDKFEFAVKYLREYQALGTAGGLYLFRDQILKNNPTEVFVLHADVCCSFPLAQMEQMHREKGGIGVILGTKVAAEVASNFGCIVSDAGSNEVLHYVEKPDSYISSTINCGVYLFTTAALFAVIREARQHRENKDATTPSSLTFFDHEEDEEEDNKLRLEQDILTPLSQTKKLFVYVTRDFWRQIKTAGSAVPANALYLQYAMQAAPGTSSITLAAKSKDGPEIVPPRLHSPRRNHLTGCETRPKRIYCGWCQNPRWGAHQGCDCAGFS